MRRREFIVLFGGATAASPILWPLVAQAQQPAMPVVGYLDPGAPEPNADVVAAFRKGLNEAGYVEGRNVTVEYRWADGRYDRLPTLAADLVGRQVAVIAATNGIPAALAAKAATTTIPVVFYVGVDPVAFGLVPSLNRPGANVTGVAGLGTELGPKRLELLHALRPTSTLFAALVNPSNSASVTQSKDLQAAASALGLQLQVLRANTDRDLDMAFETLVQLGAGGVIIGADGFMNSRFERLAALAIRHAVPAIYQYRGFVEAGGIMSYGGSITDAYRLVGAYTGRILKGERPADLPVQQATKVEFFINLKTAKALGITIPETLLATANEVIE
jgi:putative tryptophan/tyrosine transport system substrate-binding protein